MCCKKCAETYLLEDDASMPRCPNPGCRTPWSEDFLSDVMTASFLTGAYKVHRERVLLDMERARLPESQEDAVRYRDALLVVKERKPLAQAAYGRFSQHPRVQAVKTCEATYRNLLRTKGWKHEETQKAYSDWLSGDKSLSDLRDILHGEIRVIKDRVYSDAKKIVTSVGKALPQPPEGDEPAAAGAGRPNPKPAVRSEWTFVMKCTQDGCEGFVGTNWTCGLCSVRYCKDCRDPFVGDEHRDAHVCNEEKRLTVAALHKEAKPCPKCAALISKIDGCDQMWCTQCRTAFSWRTGSIEENHVHNPHYFEWMRRNGGLAPVPQHVQMGAGAPGGGGGGCWTPQQVLNHLIRYPTTTSQPDATLGWVRMIRHYEWEARRLRRTVTDEEEERRILRVKRLVNDMDDTAWKVKLQRAEKARHKRLRVCQVLETFTQAGTDVLREFMDARSDQGVLYTQLEDLVVYCNEQMRSIASRYKNEVPYLTVTTFVQVMIHPVV